MQGEFLVPHLPPANDYRMVVEAVGFNKIIQSNVTIRLGSTITLEVTLTSGGEEVTVTARPSAVSLKETKISTNLTQEEMERIPIGRQYQDTLYLAPTVVTSGMGGNPGVAGSTGSENIFLVNGLNTTDPVTGTFGTNLNFNFIREMDVATGGLDAEYGASTGGQLWYVQYNLASLNPATPRPGDYYYWIIQRAQNPNYNEKGYYTALFAQDKWSVTDNLSLSYGLRFEKNEIKPGNGGQQLCLDSWSPRLGISYDFMKNGRSKMFLNLGRFYQRLPIAMAHSMDPGHATYQDVYRGYPKSLWYRSTYGAIPTTILDGVKNQYTDELVAGLEYEIKPDLTFGFRGVFRELGRVIEDMGYIDPYGGISYIIMNPGDQWPASTPAPPAPTTSPRSSSTPTGTAGSPRIAATSSRSRAPTASTSAWSWAPISSTSTRPTTRLPTTSPTSRAETCAGTSIGARPPAARAAGTPASA